MTKFAEQLGFPEAPVLLPDGDFLFVEMDPAKGWTIRFSADGRTRKVVAKTVGRTASHATPTASCGLPRPPCVRC